MDSQGIDDAIGRFYRGILWMIGVPWAIIVFYILYKISSHIHMGWVP